MSKRTDEQIHRGFEAGNYANAYETTDYSKAIASLSMNRSKAYVAAFTLGFFGSYEPHEIGEQHQPACNDAWILVGKRAKELGIAVECPIDFGNADSEDYHTSMNYGQMPDRELFDLAFDARCPDGTFSFGNDPYVGNDSLNASQLWEQLETQLETHNEGQHGSHCAGDGSCRGDGCPCEDAGLWCSCVLGLLGFEWI